MGFYPISHPFYCVPGVSLFTKQRSQVSSQLPGGSLSWWDDVVSGDPHRMSLPQNLALLRGPVLSGEEQRAACQRGSGKIHQSQMFQKGTGEALRVGTKEHGIPQLLCAGPSVSRIGL